MNDIELTHEEQVLYNRIIWDSEEMISRASEEQQDVLTSADALAHQLRARGAIPRIRLDLFSNPDLNMAGRGKSPLQVLEQKGATTRSTEFLRHLWYFIHGPRLPEETIQGVERIVIKEIGATAELVKELGEFIQRQFEKHRLGPAAATEVEKLSHEVGYGRYAEQLRKAALGAMR